MKIIICVFLTIGAVYALPTDDSFNQRDPIQIKISNEELIPLLLSKDEELATPPLGQDLIESSDPDVYAIKDENLEPAESFGFGYGGWGRRYGGWGRRYGGWGGYGGRRYYGPGWGRGFGGYGGYGRRWGGYW